MIKITRLYKENINTDEAEIYTLTIEIPKSCDIENIIKRIEAYDPEADKRCGTCKYWRKDDVVGCDLHRRLAIKRAPNDGKDCAGWVAKEPKPKEANEQNKFRRFTYEDVGNVEEVWHNHIPYKILYYSVYGLPFESKYWIVGIDNKGHPKCFSDNQDISGSSLYIKTEGNAEKPKEKIRVWECVNCVKDISFRREYEKSSLTQEMNKDIYEHLNGRVSCEGWGHDLGSSDVRHIAIPKPDSERWVEK